MADGRSEIEGSARLELIAGVRLLHPEDAVLEAMLKGWERQQLGGKGLQDKTVGGRRSVVRQFMAFTDKYPWHWRAADLDEWMAELVSKQNRATSTLRTYQGAVGLFVDYLLNPVYEWVQVCEEHFGTHPVPILHDGNRREHLADYEGDEERRPMTRDECQLLFDHIDERVERAIRRGRKGALTAYRDSTLFKTIYGWGLRASEASGLNVADLYRNAKAPEFGRYGMMHVRKAKGSKGTGPRRRNVASIMPWAVEALEDYVVNIRPRYGFDSHPALWLTERGGRLKPRDIDDRFAIYRKELKLPEELVPHCLRHSYVTHNIEDGVDPKFIQDQVGHLYASTTALYTAVSSDFANTMMRKAIDLAFDNETARTGTARSGRR
ncbi:tyrosine-type recombinase/integrase [Kitasatospora sp. NPDC002551]|uniref:tyrosine-type recombinase/integrase n=1 Tax=Kitasatospora sp. NPDC002551 TaxID=3154539 RepID=UPI0033186067